MDANGNGNGSLVKVLLIVGHALIALNLGALGYVAKQGYDVREAVARIAERQSVHTDEIVRIAERQNELREKISQMRN